MTARNLVARPGSAAWAMGRPLVLVLGEFDDQDRILGGERHQDDEADLGIKVERQAGDIHARVGAGMPTVIESRTETGIDQLS